MVRFLTAAVAALLSLAPGTAWAGEHDPKPGNDSGCCFQLTNSPVILCMTANACKFASPPAGPK